MTVTNLEGLIGNTPLYSPQAFCKAQGVDATLLCKLEAFNPAGSAKDRVALFMLNDAEEKGLLTRGGTVIEPTSGNTGIGLASLGASRGYRVILTMPDSMSAERRQLLAAYGAEIVLTPGKDGMRGAIEEAQRLASEIPNSFIPSQFDNPANPMAHYKGTGPEIWQASDGYVDALVAGVGTGGTLSGVGKFLKEQNPNCHIVAVEPASSPLLSEGHAGAHGIQGIGANFIPANLDTELCDEVIAVADEEAMSAARSFAKSEGILVGISAGAALFAACKLAKRPEFWGKHIAVILPDSGERYLSTPLFAKEDPQ
ncbi:MAG: cysteine synthase A [Clostridia bacterium]|nr:cysteine synthase A [Clostridia bacterium]